MRRDPPKSMMSIQGSKRRSPSSNTNSFAQRYQIKVKQDLTQSAESALFSIGSQCKTEQRGEASSLLQVTTGCSGSPPYLLARTVASKSDSIVFRKPPNTLCPSDNKATRAQATSVCSPNKSYRLNRAHNQVS